MKNIDKLKQINSEETLIDGTLVYSSDTIPLQKLANIINKPTVEILKFFFYNKKFLNINSILNEKDINDICKYFAIKTEKINKDDKYKKNDSTNIHTDKNKFPIRVPIVTVVGHVDHGKTTLLDYIRKSNTVKRESGGITQKIGAYQIKFNDKKITFLDTPGHEAFSDVRVRGTNIADITVIVIAADDGIKPQTIESIKAAKNANTMIIVFVNKIDKPNVNTDKILAQISEYDLVPES
jgi:translation initiation factor IF-2